MKWRKMAAAYMRASGTAIREVPISERTPPKVGQVTARAVAKDDAHVAFATAGKQLLCNPFNCHCAMMYESVSDCL